MILADAPTTSGSLKNIAKLTGYHVATVSMAMLRAAVPENRRGASEFGSTETLHGNRRIETSGGKVRHARARQQLPDHRLCSPIGSPGDKVRCALYRSLRKFGLRGIKAREVLMQCSGRLAVHEVR